MGMAELVEMRKQLDRMEAKEGRSGAIPAAPKQKLLDVRDVADKMPDHHVRWISTKDVNKMQLRKEEGYEVIPLAEGGQQKGDLVLCRIPIERYTARVKQQERLNQERLKQHDREMEETADAVARILHDKYGMDVQPSEILVRGG